MRCGQSVEIGPAFVAGLGAEMFVFFGVCMCDKPGDVCFYPIIFTQTLEKSKEMLLSILDFGARFDDLHLQLLQANATQLRTTKGALLPLF